MSAERWRMNQPPPRTDSSSPATATAVFAGGCFWCTEAVFEQLRGVFDVESGYAGGTAETADYRQVCSGLTGHAEAIRVTYDPSVLSYDQLLDVFFDSHDPTQLNRQGNDVGPQYRSAIFFASEEQRQAAERQIARRNASGQFPRPLATTLERLTTFFPAEAYHQDYARQHPDQAYIVFQTWPKVCKIRDLHAPLIAPDDSPRDDSPRH